MREIKFRVWNRKEKVMYPVWSLFWFDFNLYIDWAGLGDRLVDAWLIKDCELMQYTGLTDTNGKEIYEGDIIQVRIGNKKENMLVYFKDGYFGWGKIHEGKYSFDPFDSEDIKVIGNLYENFELLERVIK